MSEAQLVNGLDISNSNISDITGISFFTSMKSLICNNNLLTSLVIDDAVILNRVIASNNALTVFDVNLDPSENNGLDLSYNNLTSLAIPTGNYYEAVNISHNQLTNLVLQNNNFYYIFDVSYNNLSQISGNAFISGYTYFNNNQFSLLDLSNIGFDNECLLFWR